MSHPDYRYEITSKEDSIAFSRFLTFTDHQLKELATRYPTVKDFWFDGTWDASIKKNGWWTAHAEQMLKELVPGVTVNSRLRADDYGKSTLTVMAVLWEIMSRDMNGVFPIR